jgi:hypothetical protein
MGQISLIAGRERVVSRDSIIRGPTDAETVSTDNLRVPGRPKGYKVSEDTKALLREKNLGRTLSQEAKDKIRAAKKGKARTLEARVAISRGQYKSKGAHPVPKPDAELTPVELERRREARRRLGIADD